MSGLLPVDALALGAGACLGAMSRYQCGKMATDFIATDPQRWGKLAGWHTAGINIGGSFLLGCIAATPTVDSKAINQATQVSLQKASTNYPSPAMFSGLSPRAKLMLGVGFCGSFTTFSTYSVDVVTWVMEGKNTKAVQYVLTNNVGGLLAAAAGMVLMKRFLG
eukprot:Nitzschia sp. Nitz4//scaffold113_size70149//39429//39920//NITZ4_005953-RA/size70149-processed-gene-0.74-mRNA-1//-1//CDS//3329533350//6944//frame0